MNIWFYKFLIIIKQIHDYTNETAKKHFNIINKPKNRHSWMEDLYQGLTSTINNHDKDGNNEFGSSPFTQ